MRDPKITTSDSQKASLLGEVDGFGSMGRRHFLGIAAAASSALLLPTLASCGSDDDNSAPAASGGTLEERAEEEGGLRLYTIDDAMAAALADGFKKSYPWAEVDFVIGSQSDVRNRAITESVSGVETADVITLNDSSRQALMENQTVRAAKIAGTDALPAEVIDPTDFGHPFYWFVITYAYNSDLVDAPPPDVAGLSDPKWKGLIAIDEPQNAATSATFMVSRLKELGQADWEAWIRDVNANEPLVTTDASAALEQVLRGERALSLNSHQDVLALPKGSPVKVGFYPNMVPIIQYAWLTTKGENPNAGELFVQWMISEPGQEAIASTGRAPVLDIDTPVSMSNILPAGTQIMPASDLAAYYDDPQPILDFYGEVFSG